MRLPLVSIVVVNHDGAEHLRRLLPGLSDRTDYPHFELIVVDNGSRDDSVALLRSGAWSFPVCVVENPGNESFSDACNQGAAKAQGELLLFLNNDTEPFESGWLHELVACLLDNGAGAVGATLIFPHEDLERFPHGFAVQHRGLRFRDEQGTIGPALHGWEADPLDERLGEDLESPVVVAACLLVEAALFERVGGFTHGFLYGSEDIDLCFKLRAAGRSVICSGRSLVIHRPGSTRRALPFEQAHERKLRNHRLLLERWGPRLRREHDLDVLGGGGMWVQVGREQGASSTARAEAEALGLCVRAGCPSNHGEGLDPADELWAKARVRRLRCLLLRDEAVDDPRGLEYDVALHLRAFAHHKPARGQFNVLWTQESAEQPAEAEFERYDLVLTGDARRAIRLRAVSTTAVEVVPDAAGAVLDAALAAAQADHLATRIGAPETESQAVGVPEHV